MYNSFKPITVTMLVASESFKKLPDPLGRSTSLYEFFVKADDVAKGIPMGTNPRDQKLTSNLAVSVDDSLTSNDGDFYKKNRGIILSAERVHYNNRTNVVTLTFSDPEVHGNIDGGHTYAILQKHIGEGLNQYVKFEVMTSVEDIIEPLAEARNKSVQVDDKSLAELEGKFAPVKDAIGGMPFYNRIAFKQNMQTEDSDGKRNKMIDARDIVAILGMFDIDRYNANSHPIQAYSAKKKVLENYLADISTFEKLGNIACDVFDLYDEIEVSFADAYNESGGRYG